MLVVSYVSALTPREEELLQRVVFTVLDAASPKQHNYNGYEVPLMRGRYENKYNANTKGLI